QQPRLAEFFLRVNRDEFESLKTLDGYASAMIGRLRWVWSFYFGPVLVLPLVGTLRRDRAVVLAWSVVLSSIGSMLVCTYFRLHYIAPAAGAAVLLWTLGLRWLLAHWTTVR